MKIVIFLALAVASLLALPQSARAHALEPGYLSIEPLGPQSYRIFWRKPDVNGRPMPIRAVLPETCEPNTGPDPRSDGRAWRATWIATCPEGISSGLITIEGLSDTSTDVLVRYETDAGQTGSERLTRDRTAFSVPRDAGAGEVFQTYIWLGVEHILSGWDHLLFVLLLMILVPDRWRLVGAITAFTVAHSITLSLAALGWVALPPKPVEVVIALSIMFLASEVLLRRGGSLRLSERAPWIVTFSFGLLHGFGFAGALREIGLPQHETPMALFAFNAGVELGQLAFVFAILVPAAIGHRLMTSGADRITRIGLIPVTYAIGCLSAFWFLERIVTP